MFWGLTGSLGMGAGEASIELSVSSLVSFALGFEKDLKKSDFSCFSAIGLLIELFSARLLFAGEADLPDMPLDDGRSEC